MRYVRHRARDIALEAEDVPGQQKRNGHDAMLHGRLRATCVTSEQLRVQGMLSLSARLSGCAQSLVILDYVHSGWGLKW